MVSTQRAFSSSAGGDPSDVKIPLPEVSSRHAQIMWDPGEESFVLTDLGSKIGTFVNAERIAPGEARPLSVGRSLPGRPRFRPNRGGSRRTRYGA